MKDAMILNYSFPLFKKKTWWFVFTCCKDSELKASGTSCWPYEPVSQGVTGSVGIDDLGALSVVKHDLTVWPVVCSHSAPDWRRRETRPRGSSNTSREVSPASSQLLKLNWVYVSVSRLILCSLILGYFKFSRWTSEWSDLYLLYLEGFFVFEGFHLLYAVFDDGLWFFFLLVKPIFYIKIGLYCDLKQNSFMSLMHLDLHSLPVRTTSDFYVSVRLLSPPVLVYFWNYWSRYKWE